MASFIPSIRLQDVYHTREASIAIKTFKYV